MKTFVSICVSLSISGIVCAQQKPDDSRLLDYYQNQRFAEASAYLKSVYQEPVSDAKAIAQLAYTANMAGNLPDAERYYTRLYNIDSTNTGVLYSLAGINLRRGNNARAEEFYRKLAVEDSTNFLVYKQLARISQDKADFASTIGYLQKANKLNPAEPDVASDLAELYINIKMTDQAEKVLNVATAADPENITLLESLMKLVYAQKKWPETVTACNKLIAAGNEAAVVKSKLGIAYYNLRNYTCGAETFADIAAIGQNETTYYYAAMCYKALKDQRTALNLLQLAIKDGISPAIPAYYGEIANSNELLKNYGKAAIAYQKGLQFQESPLMLYSLANLYETHLKDKKSALKYFRKYLAAKHNASEKPYVNYATSRVIALIK